MRSAIFLLFFYHSAAVFSQTTADAIVVAKQIDSLILVSRTLAKQGDFDKALEVNAAAEKTALDKLGRESAAYGSCCLNRGMVHNRMGNFKAAEKWYLEAMAIRKTVLGESHSDYAASLTELATLYSMTGNYEKAEPLYLEAIAIKSKVSGKNDPDYCRNIINLGTMYEKAGHPEKAEPLYLEAKSIFENGLNNRTHPFYLFCLNNLAHLYSNLGDFEKAESFFLETISAREKTVGKQHPSYIESLAGLGITYTRLGNYTKAESLFLEGKATAEQALGNQHPEYARSLTTLATLYKITGDYDKSEQLYLEAISVLKKTIGEEHPYYIVTRNDMANLYVKMGNYAKAEPLLVEALANYESKQGKTSPDYATGLNNLAYMYALMGDYEKAEHLYLEAKDIYEIRLNNRRHPFYHNCLYNLAKLYKTTNEFEKAAPFFEELVHVNRTRISRGAHHLSERELSNYLLKFSEIQEQNLSFTQMTGGKKSVPACYDNALFYKGFLLNAAGRLKRLALTNPASTETFNRLKTCESRLAAQYALPPAEREGVAELETEAGNLEKDLARTVEAARQVGWQDVQAALKPGEAAIEFVHYRFWKKEQTDSVMYAALIVLPAGQPAFVPLFEEKTLDSLLSTAKARKSDYVNRLYNRAKTGPAAAAKQAPALYEMVWQPLEAILAGTKTVYVAPTGLLHRLNLGAIPVPAPAAKTATAETLADRLHLITLGSTRFLLPGIGSPAPYPSHTAALLFGAVRYESDSSAIAAKIDFQNTATASRRAPGFENTDSTDRGGSWTFLPWTEKEVNSIAPMLRAAGLQPSVRSGFAATEEFFKTVGAPSPRILHIATHGYFFPDPKQTVDGGRQTVDGGRLTVDGKEPVYKMSEHPMIRSGLLLAGANHAWETGKPIKPGMEDGILTAYEISQMDLSNTELVVLSACETGLGDIQGNEGVYGLQRAFKIAGAKYLIMSLWQVPDFQTQELMTVFYQKWLTDKMTIPDAFQAAQQQMRAKYEHPYFWAGFVLVE